MSIRSLRAGAISARIAGRIVEREFLENAATR
jgi:hypothetical protein